MNMFPTPLAGSYAARTRNFGGSFNTFYTSCEVLGESPKSYAIRIAFPIGGHKAKETMTVRKHNVRFKEVEPVQHDCSKEWWNQLD